ncbi:MAG: penicillin-binding protein 1A [Parvibaculum sp.]|nr:penicillin-binding protein 1A [Parvibaculum sp.]
MASSRDRSAGGGRGPNRSSRDAMTRRVNGLGPVRIGVGVNEEAIEPRLTPDQPPASWLTRVTGSKRPAKRKSSSGSSAQGSGAKLTTKGMVLRADASMRAPMSSLEDDEAREREEARARKKEQARQEPKRTRRDPAGTPNKRIEPKAKDKARAKSKPEREAIKAEAPRQRSYGGGYTNYRDGGAREKTRRTAPKKSGGFFNGIAYWTTVIVLWFAIGIGCLLFYYAMSLPDTSGLWNAAHAPSLSILADDGETLSHRGDLRGGMVMASDLPAHVSQAVIATEDQRFYWHFGVDPVGLARAAYQNFKAGYIVQGGSTLTQQLAKNVFLTSDRTLSRKIQEMLLAVWLEARYSKDQILTLYLNRVYFGGGAYGVEGASERFFKKPARDLTLSEAAMLAGLLKAPSHYSPTNNIDRARARAAIVLDNMLRAGFITQADEKYALTHPASLEGYSASGSINYFVDWVADVLPAYTGEQNSDLIVRTTIDPAMQKAAEDVVAELLKTEGAQLNVTQAAVVAMTPDGAVRAMVGGRSYGQSQFNRAVQAQRQPGSAFKPFVYLTAMEYGMTPDTKRIDRPVTYGTWSPSNYTDRYSGSMTLTRALAESINTISVQVAQEIGIRNVIRTAQRLGIQESLPANLSLALGTCDVNLLELTAAYATFANGGYGVIPHNIEDVHTKDGNEVYRRQGSGLGRVMSEDVMGEMNHMMREVMVSGTGRNAALEGRPTAGKTGTSQDFRDAWFIGYSADIVVGVWVGNDNRAPMKKVTGGGLPAKIWHQFMERTQTNVAVSNLPGQFPFDGAAPVAIAGPDTGDWVTNDAEPAADAKRQWEEPGFFERLFGTGPQSGNDGLRPRHDPAR